MSSKLQHRNPWHRDGKHSLELKRGHEITSAMLAIRSDHFVRFGSKADVRTATGHVRFTPNSDRESRHAAMVMSALHPKADMCGANHHVCFGPIADIRFRAAPFWPSVTAFYACNRPNSSALRISSWLHWGHRKVWISYLVP
jgi:hypothetical protein